MCKEKRRRHSLVIGGTGFIGSNLVRCLVEAGDDVTVYHREGSNLKNLEGVPFKSALGDLTDENGREKTLCAAMKDKCTVYNLAASGTSLEKERRLREIVNVEAVRSIARVAREIGGIRLIHASSSAAVGFPDNPEIADENFAFNAHANHYSVTKRQGEREVLNAVEKGLDAVIGIPCSSLGAHGMKTHQYNLFVDIARGRTLVYPPGGLCLTNVTDLVKGLVLCRENGLRGKRYILGGQNMKYQQYFTEIATATGGRPPRVRLPKTLLPWLGFGVEFVSSLLGRENTIDKHVGEMITKNLYYSSGLAIQELGYAITDWRETIRSAVAGLRGRGLI